MKLKLLFKLEQFKEYKNRILLHARIDDVTHADEMSNYNFKIKFDKKFHTFKERVQTCSESNSFRIDRL